MLATRYLKREMKELLEKRKKEGDVGEYFHRARVVFTLAALPRIVNERSSLLFLHMLARALFAILHRTLTADVLKD